MRYFHVARLPIFAATLALGTMLSANDSKPSEDAAFQTWLEGVKVEARERGIKEETLTQALSDIKPIVRVIKR
ncbi:MAG: hypothetical protein AB3N28_12370, partial [Kordiimonas sp.]